MTVFIKSTESIIFVESRYISGDGTTMRRHAWLQKKALFDFFLSEKASRVRIQQGIHSL